jgi:hypothetical protein
MLTSSLCRSKWINQLHKNKNCCSIIHEFLDLIEDHMLVVQSNELGSFSGREVTQHIRKRANCPTVLGAIASIDASLTRLEGKLTGTPQTREFTGPHAIEVKLSKEASDAARNRTSELREHTGTMTPSPPIFHKFISKERRARSGFP